MFSMKGDLAERQNFEAKVPAGYTIWRQNGQWYISCLFRYSWETGS